MEAVSIEFFRAIFSALIMLRSSRKDIALEALSQLTTAACGLVLGIATAPRARRAVLSKALVVFRRLSTVCVYSKALVVLPPQTADDVCGAWLTCADEGWVESVGETPSAFLVLVTCAALLIWLLVSTSGRSADEKNAAQPLGVDQPPKLEEGTTKPTRSRPTARRYVSVEYEALVASTMACKPASS